MSKLSRTLVFQEEFSEHVHVKLQLEQLSAMHGAVESLLFGLFVKDRESANLVAFSSKLPDEFKDPIMLGTPEENLAYHSIYKQTAALQSEMPPDELSDALTQWLGYWTKYAAEISVPVMYGLAEVDNLWSASEQSVRNFAAAFQKSPRVESGIILGSAHCSELCKVSRGWYTRAFGFAMECAVAKELKRF